eukprot:COSAG01_NODE_12496_length_1729_cov_1.821472_2_plen_202_part_00
MRDNRLSGSLPDVRAWSDLRSVDLDSNELEGDLSGFAQLPKLTVLIMHNLRLAGTLPQQLCKVYECDARDNHWQCPLPWAHALPRNASRNASRNGSNCCLVDKCTNGSVMRQPRSTVGGVQGAAARYLVEARRRTQADPGDNRPYGPGCAQFDAVVAMSSHVLSYTTSCWRGPSLSLSLSLCGAWMLALVDHCHCHTPPPR